MKRRNPSNRALPERKPRTIAGTYALVLRMPRARVVRVGRLGACRFPRGYYLYLGSAMNGLSARIARHIANSRLAAHEQAPSDDSMARWSRRRKKLFWHIDYLLLYARVVEVWTHVGPERFEHLWAQSALILPRARVIMPRFGASDCNCAAHLVYYGHSFPSKGLI